MELLILVLAIFVMALIVRHEYKDYEEWNNRQN